MATPIIDAKRHYTVEEYFALDAASDSRLEYYDGRIIPHPDDVVRDTPAAMAGATKPHNRVIGNLRFALDGHLRAQGSACEVFAENIRVELDTVGRFAYPDLVLTCDDRADDPLTVRRPVLIVEVFSPSTAPIDRGRKFDAYRAIPSLDQIVLIEPRWVAVDSYTRNPDGATWTLTALRALEDELLIRPVAGRIALAELYRRVLLSNLRPWDSDE